jgi:ankyrin repeat protein
MQKFLLLILSAISLPYLYAQASDSLAEAFLKAATQGDIVKVQSMLNNGIDVNVRHPITEWTALIGAAYYGRKDVVHLLIESRADVNAKDKNHGTALLKAVTLGPYENLQDHLIRKADIVRALLKAGADPQYRDPIAGTAWEIAMINGHSELIQAFEEAGVKGVKETRMIHAASIGDAWMVKRMLEDKADVNYLDSDRWSALSEATLAGHFEILKLLIDSGANVNLKHEKGWTCLMIAAQKNREDVVRFLLKAGADPAIRNDDGSTAAIIAEQEGNLVIAQLLK